MKTDKKLFLASFTAFMVGELVKFIGKNPTEVKVAFITTPADTYEDKWFMEKDIEALGDAGFVLDSVDIKESNQQALYKRLHEYDVICISGGNVFYMMEKSLETGFFEALKKLLSEGKVYVGGSAGAVLIGPSLEPVKTLDKPEFAPGLKDYNGPGFVDFVVIPHFGEVKYKDKMDKIINDYKNSDYKLLPLANNQAVEILGDKTKIVKAIN